MSSLYLCLWVIESLICPVKVNNYRTDNAGIFFDKDTIKDGLKYLILQS